jgi:hypothetical protein
LGEGGVDTEQHQKKNNCRTDNLETGNEQIYRGYILKEKLNISNTSSIYCQNI